MQMRVPPTETDAHRLGKSLLGVHWPIGFSLLLHNAIAPYLRDEAWSTCSFRVCGCGSGCAPVHVRHIVHSSLLGAECRLGGGAVATAVDFSVVWAKV